MQNDNEALIKGYINERVEAIRKRDAVTASKHYATNILLFDLVGPLQHTEDNAVQKRLEEWMGAFSDDPQYEIDQLDVRAERNVAFCHSIHHVNTVLQNGNRLDMWWRETLCWQCVDGNWTITHAHSSVPFDAANGQAAIGLKPDKG